MIPFRAYDGHEFTIENGVISGDDGFLVTMLNTIVAVELVGWGIHLGPMDEFAIIRLKELISSLDVRAEWINGETIVGVDY